MMTPDEIVQKCQRAYAKFVTAWVQGEIAAYFPLHVRGNLAPVKRNVPATIAAVERLRQGSKEAKGWGYTVYWKQVRSREFGSNRFPDQITIDTLDDLLRLTKRREEFAAMCRVADRVRSELPRLDPWVTRHARTLSALDEHLDGLIAVTRYFLDHPWPDRYARQIPVAVDTKFIEQQQGVLRQWLDELLPATAIQADEAKFAQRFGLRDGQPHRGVRLLDVALQCELGVPFDEFSLPPRHLSQLGVRDAVVIIVENQLNLLTLPPVARGIGIRGEGKAVSRLAKVPWLAENELVYWGDIDVEGFQILSNLRTLFPRVKSILMDGATLNQHARYIVAGNATIMAEPANLTLEELQALRLCMSHNQRLEQEHIVQDYVDRAFRGAHGGGRS
jgi:hypothetical protein